MATFEEPLSLDPAVTVLVVAVALFPIGTNVGASVNVEFEQQAWSVPQQNDPSVHTLS